MRAAMVNFVTNLAMSDQPAACVGVKPGPCVKVKWMDEAEGKATDFCHVLARGGHDGAR